jgi:putative chitinase
MLTKEKLFKMFPNAAKSKLDLDTLLNALNHAFSDPAGLSTLERRAAFLAQLAHESGEFCLNKENLNYSATGLLKTFKKYFPTQELADQYAKKPEKIANRVYANRMGNGDEASGDGFKFRGRGFLQLTGKSNYLAAGKSIGVDLVANPDYVASSQGAIDSALWFWKTNSLNSYADRDDIKGMTKVINGGMNGLDERIAFYDRAKSILPT